MRAITMEHTPASVRRHRTLRRDANRPALRFLSDFLRANPADPRTGMAGEASPSRNKNDRANTARSSSYEGRAVFFLCNPISFSSRAVSSVGRALHLQ